LTLLEAICAPAKDVQNSAPTMSDVTHTMNRLRIGLLLIRFMWSALAPATRGPDSLLALQRAFAEDFRQRHARLLGRQP
jgi:hypothetical protein